MRYRVPAQPAGCIDRPRILAAIDHAMERTPVVVVSAPGGFGKTTAVAEWAGKRNGQLAWLSLGVADSDPAILASGIIEALRVMKGAGPRSHASPAIPEGGITVIYRRLCESLMDMSEVVHLVIDDAQRAGQGLTSGLLGMLLESAPDNLHLVLVGTPYLELAFARRIAAEPAAILTSTGLAFDNDELEQLTARAGSPISVENLVHETQGWPIAAHMAVTGSDHQSEAEWTSGTLLCDYVAKYVLASLPNDISTFILTTTVCSELTPDLAKAVSDNPDSARILDNLASEGYFLQRFYNETQVSYRWHPVFAQQCLRISLARSNDGLTDAHLRAARFLENMDPLAAMGHLVAAGDQSAAVEIMMRNWVRLLMDDQAAAVAHWCAGLGQPLGQDARILLVWACAEDSMGERKVALTRFTRAARLIASNGADTDTRAIMALARLFLEDDRTQAIAASAVVQDILGEPYCAGGLDQAALLLALGWIELRLGVNPGLSLELLSAASRDATARGGPTSRRRVLGHLAAASAAAGQHRKARGILRELELSQNASARSWSTFGGEGRALAAGSVAYWAADLSTANEELTRAIESDDSRVSVTSIARLMLALSAAASSDVVARRRAASELQAVPQVDVHGLPWGMLRETAIAVLQEAAGKRAKALAIARRHADSAYLPLPGVALAGVLRRSGDQMGALHLLTGLRAFGEISYVRVATRATLALVHKSRGEIDIAHELCESALDTAHAEEIRLPFCDGDLSMRLLLSEHLLRRTNHEAFITECLTENRDGGVLEALSDRETDVFRLLQTSRTIKEIALSLNISVNTVKTHQRSIYRKLGVQNRRDAQQVST